MEHTPNIKGIRIRTVNMVMLFLSLALFVVVIITTWQIAKEYRASVQATEDYIKWEKAAHTLHVGSDYLTEEARLYARTLDRHHAANFFNEIYSNKSRERAIEFLAKNHVDPDHMRNLQKALDLSNALTHREYYAMRLIAEATHQDLATFPADVSDIHLSEADRLLDSQQKIERARSMLFDNEYATYKNEIRDALAKFLDENLAITKTAQITQTKKLGEVLQQQRIVLIALCILNVLTFAMIIVLIVKPLQVYLKCIKNDKMFEIVGAYEFKHLALTYNDIFAMKEHHDKLLKHQAEHDPLTGLMNRSGFNDLRRLLQSSPDPIGLALVDVDKFKEINDTYGHVIGDKTLCRIAGLLEHSFRSEDFCIRLGGDEFAIVFKGMTSDFEGIVRAKINSINKQLQEPEGKLPPTSISVGVAFSIQGFQDNLYDNADTALYEVKERGRCGCAFYHNINSERRANKNESD